MALDRAYLLAQRNKLQNAIAFGVSSKGNLNYARAMLAQVETKLAAMAADKSAVIYYDENGRFWLIPYMMRDGQGPKDIRADLRGAWRYLGCDVQDNPLIPRDVAWHSYTWDVIQLSQETRA